MKSGKLFWYFLKSQFNSYSGTLFDPYEFYLFIWGGGEGPGMVTCNCCLWDKLIKT